MMPQMDPKMVKAAMKRLGIKQEDVEAERVIIETSDKNIIINNPEVSKVDMQGKISFQVSGDVTEEAREYVPSDEDIELVMEKTNAEKEKVIETLKEKNGDIAESIMELSK